MSRITMGFRQVHLDFHTSEQIPEVASDFDAAEFVETLERAEVNSVTVFAKCHHGMSYYDTKVGVRHPHLKRDLLGEMIEACHARDIRTPVYVSVGQDEWAAEHHADWRRLYADGRLEGPGAFGAWWRPL